MKKEQVVEEVANATSEAIDIPEHLETVEKIKNRISMGLETLEECSTYMDQLVKLIELQHEYTEVEQGTIDALYAKMCLMDWCIEDIKISFGQENF